MSDWRLIVVGSVISVALWVGRGDTRTEHHEVADAATQVDKNNRHEIAAWELLAKMSQQTHGDLRAYFKDGQVTVNDGVGQGSTYKFEATINKDGQVVVGKFVNEERVQTNECRKTLGIPERPDT